MRAYQTMVASDGYEVMLFPLEYMYISQDEGGSYSHQGTLSMDFLGWDANGRVYLCPYYAPCTCKLVYKSTSGAYNIFDSVNLVHTPSGLQNVCFMVAHDNTLPFNIGDIVQQGDLLGHTGTAGNVTGDHVHLNIASGHYQGQEQVPPDNNWQLINSIHVYNGLYVNDTVIVNGMGHNWLEYSGGIKPLHKNLKFKWVLYANKIRSKAQNN